MPTARELGLKIGDWVMFPSVEGETHTAKIVGPQGLPNDFHILYIAPPEPEDRAITVIYNPKTGKERDVFDFEDGRKIELNLGPGEVLAQKIHAGYSLFRRVNGQPEAANKPGVKEK
jgi:hypothetical protein